jgi:nucleoside-diphosphate-sugar epimerase
MSELESSNFRMRGRLDIGAAREQLKFSPKYTLEEGIKSFANDFRIFDS